MTLSTQFLSFLPARRYAVPTFLQTCLGTTTTRPFFAFARWMNRGSVKAQGPIPRRDPLPWCFHWLFRGRGLLVLSLLLGTCLLPLQSAEGAAAAFTFTNNSGMTASDLEAFFTALGTKQDAFVVVDVSPANCPESKAVGLLNQQNVRVGVLVDYGKNCVAPNKKVGVAVITGVQGPIRFQSGSWTFTDAGPKPLAQGDVKQVAARPARPIDGSATASATRVGDDAASQVRISGKFTFPESLSLGTSTVAITNVLGELSANGAGELLKGDGRADVLPVLLFARPGGKANAALFESDPKLRPKLRMEIKNRDPGRGLFEFTLKIDKGTVVFPRLCTGLGPETNLTTSFVIIGLPEASGEPPVGMLPATTTQSWRCLDLTGDDPMKPRSLRAP